MNNKKISTKNFNTYFIYPPVKNIQGPKNNAGQTDITIFRFR